MSNLTKLSFRQIQEKCNNFYLNRNSASKKLIRETYITMNDRDELLQIVIDRLHNLIKKIIV